VSQPPATTEDLRDVARLRPLPHPFRKPPLRIDFPRLSAAENAAWQDRLETFRLECGCQAAAIGLALFTLVVAAYVVTASLSPGLTAQPDTPAIAWALVAFVAGLIFSTLAGKAVGLFLAHRRYRRACQALLGQLDKAELR